MSVNLKSSQVQQNFGQAMDRALVDGDVIPDDGQALLAAIYGLAEIMPALGPVQAYTRDPKDDKFVACALLARAEHLVSVDRDILALQSLGTVQMLTPYALLQVLHDPGQN